VDVFNLSTVELGNLAKIRIGHDEKLFGGDWYVSQYNTIQSAMVRAIHSFIHSALGFLRTSKSRTREPENNGTFPVEDGSAPR
jgi:hypothetical protein